MKKYIAYTRVSTTYQNLGQDSQYNIIQNWIKGNGGELINHYTERVSGKNNKRIELNKAIADCQINQACLIVSTLDRLSRNVRFLFDLKDAKIEFVCCDMPELNTLTLSVLGGWAQYERELISERTKKSLRVLKDKGVKLGKPENLANNLDKAVKHSVETRLNKALTNKNNIRAYTVVKMMRDGDSNWSAIARHLNLNGFKTSRNKSFEMQTVKNLYNLFSNQ